MQHSEQVLNRLLEIAENTAGDLIESCAIFCEENDLDHIEFINALDPIVIQQLKYNAIKHNRVRKCVATIGHEFSEG